MIAYHIGCCCKHAGFEVPEAASANAASIESVQRGMWPYQQAVSITSLSGLCEEMQDSHFTAVRYLLNRASAINAKLLDAWFFFAVRRENVQIMDGLTRRIA